MPHRAAPPPPPIKMEKRAEIPFGSVRLGAAVIVDQGFGVPPSHTPRHGDIPALGFKHQ